MIDVVLPVLDEAAALPRVLASLLPGYRAIVVDNGSSDGSAGVARALGATVVDEPHRGFGAACAAGLAVAEAEIVCFMDCDGSLDGADLPRVAGPVASGAQDLVLGRRRAEAGSWPVHAAIANAVLAAGVRRRTGLPIRDLGPMRAVRRTALDRPRHDRSSLRLAPRDGPAGRPRRVARPRGRRAVRAPRRSLQGHGNRARIGAGRDGHATSGPGPAMTARMAIAVLAKTPVPGRVKTRLCPPCTPAQAASLARAALEDTLAAVTSVAGAHPVLVLDGDPSEWADRIAIVPQRGRGLDERLASAFADLGGPAVLVGMDTPTAQPAPAERSRLAAPGAGHRCRPGPGARRRLLARRTPRS